jgi:hypothetical protein
LEAAGEDQEELIYPQLLSSKPTYVSKSAFFVPYATRCVGAARVGAGKPANTGKAGAIHGGAGFAGKSDCRTAAPQRKIAASKVMHSLTNRSS